MIGEEPEIDLLLGRVVLGRYRLVRELARGGMGAIYLARSEGAASFVKPVVVKRMLPEFIGDSDAARMFKREARIMSTLRHPGIVSVFDFGHEEHGYMLVMDYVHGFHLGRWAGWTEQTRGEVPVAIAVHIVVQVLEALHYAHTLQGPDGEALDIVHRDVSPSNVLLDIGGHVRLADFGIAQSQADAPDVKTTTRTVKGKFSYLAPEILEGGAPTAATDAYSSAVVLHEVLVGRNEFRTASPTSTIGRVLTHVPSRLDELRSDVSKELADVVEQALAKKPEERFASAAELSRALRRVRGLEGEEAQVLLAETFGRDFRDPSLPAMFELPELDELERAWLAPGPPSPSAPPRSDPDDPAASAELEREGVLAAARAPAPELHRGSGRPTVPSPKPNPGQAIEPEAVHRRDEPTTGARPALVLASPRRSTGMGLIVSIAVATVAIGGAIAWAMTRPSDSGPTVVYVEASPAGITGAGDPGPAAGQGPERAPDPAVEPGQAPASDAGAAPGRIDPTSAPEPGREPGARDQRSAEERDADAIRRAFGRHTAAIRNCFSSAPGTPEELSLRFSVDAQGTVRRVELVPAEVASTPAGQCVVRHAERIDFPDGSARTFRIPLQIRSR